MKHTNEHLARVIKNQRALYNLIEQNLFNYKILSSTYKKKKKIWKKDIEFKPIVNAFTNFVLTSSIVKQYIKSFKSNLDEELTESDKYKNCINILIKDKAYLIMLGLRNYLQHIFELRIGIGNFEKNPKQKELYINRFLLIDYKKLRKDLPENKEMIDYFTYYDNLPIMKFSTLIMNVLLNFKREYDNMIQTYYDPEYTDYINSEKDQYALDMHNIYAKNYESFKK